MTIDAALCVVVSKVDGEEASSCFAEGAWNGPRRSELVSNGECTHIGLRLTSAQTVDSRPLWLEKGVAFALRGCKLCVHEEAQQ